MDLLAADGPVTAGHVSSELGIAPGSASHHLKVLSNAGLIEEAHGVSSDERKHFWKLSHPTTRWSREEITDFAARSAAFEAEQLALEQQFARSRRSLVDTADSDGAVTSTFATQGWARLTSMEMAALRDELVEVVRRWEFREIPDDGIDRQSCFVFARGFPARP